MSSAGIHLYIVLKMCLFAAKNVDMCFFTLHVLHTISYDLGTDLIMKFIIDNNYGR